MLVLPPLLGRVCVILLYMRQTLQGFCIHVILFLLFAPFSGFFSPFRRGRGGHILATPTKLRMMTGRVHRRVSLYLQKAGPLSQPD